MPQELYFSDEMVERLASRNTTKPRPAKDLNQMTAEMRSTVHNYVKTRLQEQIMKQKK